MPRIFDNIEQKLLPALQDTLKVSHRADFCVGYFNLRGWKRLDAFIEHWAGGEGECCRLLVGMHKPPQDELLTALSLIKSDEGLDNQTVSRLKKRLAQEFREQLTIGAPTNEDEAGLRRLCGQIKAKKVLVKLFLRHSLHAKLYLLFRNDVNNPAIGYLGSSNLTLAGLSQQGELNIDVLDHDACNKLARWFEDRWNDRWCVDISKELVQVIEESWARETPLSPYHIYIKIAYHLSHEARAGLAEFHIPKDFGNKLFEFQTAAVKIAARHLNKRGGVLLGDVVGLGKTLMATALARIFEDDRGWSTLIICPKNLIEMWQDHVDRYGLRAKVLSLNSVIQELPNIPARFRIVLIDESHNLRNREGKRYHAIRDYIAQSDSKCILLSATPYNKTYLDLASQLRLFVPEAQDLGARPEQYLKEKGEIEFIRLHQCSPRTLAAFEKSPHADDWRELMRLYLVRRTRSFIQENYAETDSANNRKYLTFADGTRSYFPGRVPKTAKFAIRDKDLSDQYACLYSGAVVETINTLKVPRYGLGNYVAASPHRSPTPDEAQQLRFLSRAGRRLMGFCRTNLFKRLESSGQAFLLSLERHILRNYIFLHAIENNLPLPIGTQDAGLLDARFNDTDESISDFFDEEDENEEQAPPETPDALTEGDFKRRAAEIYDLYKKHFKKRFSWLRPTLFDETLAKDLQSDVRVLFEVLQKNGAWQPEQDAKLDALFELLTLKHPHEKVLVFTQFADTVDYLEAQLQKRGIVQLAGVTGDSPNPTALAWRFSPVSNEKRQQISSEGELRVLIATDVLSEGQNLQDGCIVVNYDLPWAIIRLIQRAGRVDRIGQKSENILCYSFLPADGVEEIIKLRGRVRQRLQENAEVVGTDEAYFEDDRNDNTLRDLYTEKAGILDGEGDREVDLTSHAYEIWKQAITADSSLEKTIPALPNVVYSTKPHQPNQNAPEGVLVYLRTAQDNDSLAWIDQHGKNVTESQFAILQAAACAPETPAMPRQENHHDMVMKGIELVVAEEKTVGGQLGRPSGARFRTYERLKNYAERLQGTLFESKDLLNAVDDIYRYPLRSTTVDTLNRQLRSGISDETLAQLVIALRHERRLCYIPDKDSDFQEQEPRIICSLGLSS